jgi:predicted RNA-binding Zn-ribbon protein involved in translation (DUF1610 family)
MKISKPRYKDEKDEFKQIASIWKSLERPEITIGCTTTKDGFVLSSKGESPFICPKCSKDTFVWLQACIVPQSQYSLWCTSCYISSPISHLHLWPYIEEEYAKSKGVTVDELRQQKRRGNSNKSANESSDGPGELSESVTADTGS